MSIASPLPTLPPSPPYSPSTAAPSYSPEPYEDEHRLDFVARKQPRSVPTSTYVKKVSGITLLLSGQESGVALPSYTRNGIVRGEILLDDEASVQSVVIKLEGRQTVTVAEGGTHLLDLFNCTKTVWSRTQGSGPSTSTCPAVLPFDLPFPRGYTDSDGQNTKPLPPTFSAQYPGVPGLYAECRYTFTATVTKTGLGGWKRQKMLTTQLCFQPRSRPFLPIGTDLQPFFSTVKSAPGDWHQVISTMGARDSSDLKPLECHLFIPSVQIYAIADTIPFHLHLRGLPSSLLAFLTGPIPSSPKSSKRTRPLSISSLKMGPPSPTLSSSSSSYRYPVPYSVDDSLFPSSESSLSPVHSSSRPSIRVYLLRQICARVHGRKAWHDVVLGEGKLWPLHAQYPYLDPESGEEQSLDWEGELRCGSDVTVGGFTSGELIVKDFIMVDLRPPSPESSSLVHHQHAHPIRLVTDSYADS